MEDEVVREIMNGMWFILSVEVWLCLIYYISHRIMRARVIGQEYIIEDSTYWYHDSATQLAIALMVYMTGSGIRAGWVWGLLECQNEIGRKGCEFIATSVWVLFVASAFAIVGGLCTIRVLVPFLRPWGWLAAGVLAVAVPLIVHMT